MRCTWYWGTKANSVSNKLALDTLFFPLDISIHSWWFFWWHWSLMLCSLLSYLLVVHTPDVYLPGVSAGLPAWTRWTVAVAFPRRPLLPTQLIQVSPPETSAPGEGFAWFDSLPWHLPHRKAHNGRNASYTNHIHGLMQDCSNSTALASELPKSCVKPLKQQE